MADDDDYSDDSSDDEFLTTSGEKTAKGGGADREAMIRRKLMESFYGKTAPPSEEDEASDSDDEGDGKKPSAIPEQHQEEAVDQQDNPMTTSDDLDSPYFDPDAHTSKYVLEGTVHQVLEVEERLALQVRTLDSTMQTLVYENYSKFIDATDAIRSIGVSVTANEDGLAKLAGGIKLIDATSREVEGALGTLRDAVAEKLRIKRLLTRLDALLKLPKTLGEQIGNKKYRLATKSYLDVYAILSKHSEGFESLKNIEVDCKTILTDMVASLKHKLLHWSGGHGSMILQQSSFDSDGNFEDAPPKDQDEEWSPPPDAPTSVNEIFECASTLLIVLPRDRDAEDGADDDDDDNGITFDSGLTAEECKAAALTACVRYLERVLDSHEVALQDAMFSTDFENVGVGGDATEILDTSQQSLLHQNKESKLVPTDYLDGILEAATLYGLSFSLNRQSGLSESDRHLLWEFVNEAYSTFLTHVKSLLLERSSMDDEKEEEGDEEEKDEDADAAYSEISQAMTHLLRVVRDLASGLALPDVGVDAASASSLVEQAVEVTETMVRRRVTQKFYTLRLHVLQDCLGPFCQEAMGFAGDEPRVMEIVQMASVALSDGLQFIDDTVKSILTGGTVVSDLKGVDYAMVKQAVENCCRRFALWLAATLELLAGCERIDVTIDAEELVEEEGGGAENESPDNSSKRRMPSQAITDDASEIQQDNVIEKIDSSLQNILDEMEEASTEESRYDFLLATAEMCRLAQRSVMENINQSINATSSSGNRRHQKNTDIFASTGKSNRHLGVSEDDSVASQRFLLAASRVITLYAMNRGCEASLSACKKFHMVASQEDDGEDGLPAAPRDGIVNVLAITKQASIDCAILFGGEKYAASAPDAPDDEDDAFGAASPYGKSSTLSGNMASKGLQLDVERMFTEKMATYPHPSHVVEFSRNSIVFIVLKVAFNALVEQARTCTFSTKGYRQLQVDVMLLRHFLPHYVKDEVVAEGTNALTILDNVLNDVLTNAGERCTDIDCVGQTKFYDPMQGETTTLQSIIRDFMWEDEDPEFMTENDDVDEDEERHVKYKFIIEQETVGDD